MNLKEFYDMAKAALPVELAVTQLDVVAHLNGNGTEYEYEVQLKTSNAERWKFGTGDTPKEAIHDLRKRLGYVPKVDIEIDIPAAMEVQNTQHTQLS